jgi:hypothetical protein
MPSGRALRGQQQQPRPFNPYDAEQKEAKRNKARKRIDKMKAKQSGETSKMPPQGKGGAQGHQPTKGDLQTKGGERGHEG